MDTKIFEQLEAVFGQEIQLVRHDLAALETMIQEKMRLLGNGLLQRAVNSGPNGYQGSSIPCTCGGSMTFIQHRQKDVHTVVGWIKVRRAYYYCYDCGKSRIPYDDASGLGSESLSAGLANVCCLLAVDDSFKQVCRKTKELFGQDVSANTIERVVHQVGGQAACQQEKQWDDFVKDRQFPQAEHRPKRLYISPDGTTVHEKDGWHETKMGCIYWQDERFQPHRLYIGRFGDSDTFGRHLWLASCRCGFREAGEAVYLGDGAAWVRSIHNERFKRATFIIDWFHASEHIWDCGKSLFGEGTDYTKKWAEKLLNLLWDGWTRKLLKFLERQRNRYKGEKLEAIETLHRYISVNEEQMRYDVFRSKGYDIGSGAVEGACKHVVGKRLKQSGMIWTRGGSSAVLALRISWLNKEWDKLWLTKPLAA